MSETTLTVEQLQALDCAREPIHIPGRIQSHGVLLALEEPSLRIRQLSANTDPFFGQPAEQLLGTHLEALLPPDQLELLCAHLSRVDLSDVNPLTLTVAGGRTYDAILHRSGGLLILELEPSAGGGPSFQGFYHLVRGSVSRLQGATSLSELCNVAAEEVRRITGLDRVMVYTFDAHWNGTVIAESKPDDMEPWLGLHYPASDIPEQARRLYAVNPLRLIADIHDTPAPLLPELHPLTGVPTDLTFSVLRSVSPVHIQYLKNMEVGASMSISLIRNGQLWGLIACHHRTARHIPYVVRIACEFLGQALSLQVSLKEEHRDYQRRMELSTRLTDVLGHVAGARRLAEGLGSPGPDLVSLLDAGGAVLYLDGQVTTYGEVPDDEPLRDVLAWLDETHGRETYYTDALPAVYPEAEQFRDTGSGLLTVSLPGGSRVVWFRPEVVRTVNWAGNPEKTATVEEGGLRLHPRRSFELWKQTVRLTSAPWQEAEVRTAEQLQSALQDILYLQAEAEAKAQLELANEKLQRSNTELDWFAYIASHDLKEPLRGIQNYARFLLEDYGEAVDDEGRRKLQTMVLLGTRMEALLDALLRFSQLGRVDMAMQLTDLNVPLEEAIDLLSPLLQREHARVDVKGPLPTLFCDRAKVGEVFYNLISNGVKYSAQDDRSVEIGYEERGPEQPGAFYVRDNGIGIPERYFGAIFDMFRRLHTRDKFGGGTGVGLSIVRKIVERHGGEIWLESRPGEGTTFYFTLAPAPEVAGIAVDH